MDKSIPSLKIKVYNNGTRPFWLHYTSSEGQDRRYQMGKFGIDLNTYQAWGKPVSYVMKSLAAIQ